jgi:hypothetical protein
MEFGMTDLTPQQIMTRHQAELASTGVAIGQCSECGSYRADGKPPTLHQPGCSHKDDWLSTPDLDQ